jgi:hypothetical protein
VITAEELIRQVRAQIQEANAQGPVSDEVILDSLNRGLDYGWDILARNYSPPPDGMFEDRLLKVELLLGGNVYELTAISYQDSTPLDHPSLGGTPSAYVLTGRTIQVLPSAAASGSQLILWYAKEIPKIVKSQGRVTGFTAAASGPTNATVVLDSIGSNISTSGDFAKYFNFVNFETGEIRGSAQVQSINGNEITLKYVPTRTRVLNQTVTNDIPTELELDDYISGIDGSCVVYFSKPLSNMVIQYAVSEIRRSLGYDVGIEERKLKELENQVNYTFSKRPNTLRVKRRSSLWRGRGNY